jgi:hypothetical protein
MLEGLIASYGIGNNNDKTDYSYHLFIIGRNGTKLFFYESGVWGEDINKRAETDDFIFAYEQMAEMLKDEEMRKHIEANLLF